MILKTCKRYRVVRNLIDPDTGDYWVRIGDILEQRFNAPDCFSVLPMNEDRIEYLSVLRDSFVAKIESIPTEDTEWFRLWREDGGQQNAVNAIADLETLITRHQQQINLLNEEIVYLKELTSLPLISSDNKFL